MVHVFLRCSILHDHRSFRNSLSYVMTFSDTFLLYHIGINS
jgi:hypothetical protein